MARALANKSNVSGVTTAFPYGDVKDNTGANDGTPLNRAFLGDYWQFFEKLMAAGGITANGNEENATNGFQFFDALLAAVGPSQTPTYANSYNDNGTYPIRFRLVPGRKVQIRGRTGSTSPGAISANELIFTLPVGFRPAYFKDFQVFISSNNTYGRVRIETDGTVTVIYNSSSAISREHIHLNLDFTLD